jgi:hypothetical protein
MSKTMHCRNPFPLPDRLFTGFCPAAIVFKKLGLRGG